MKADLLYLRKQETSSCPNRKSKRKKGKGKRSNASIALTSDELNTLYEKGILGTRYPENTLWLNSTMHFGLRGCKEHREMCMGDVKLKETAEGKEYLEFNERQTTTRTGSDCRDIRAMPSKMLATDGSEKDPVVVYKLYAMILLFI